MSIQSNLKLIYRLASVVVLVVAAGQSTAHGQEFRNPDIPGISSHNQNRTQSRAQSDESRSPAPASRPFKSGFVPKSTGGGFGLVPVRPRNGALQGQVVEQFRPEYPEGRSPEDEQILARIRAGNFDDPVAGSTSRRGPQTIRQRYPNGKTQLMRQVVQDENGNYYNHGPWRLFNKRGELMASGQFNNGLMDGSWERWHSAESSGMFRTQPFVQFDAPFVSTATFSNGKLDGVWIISDRHQRKIVEVPYKDGKRHGTATWWYPTSERMRVMNFKDGLLDGSLLEWNDKQQLVRNDEYIEGMKLIRTTSLYRPKQKSSEKFYLEGQLELDGEDNWWDALPAEYVQSGTRVQHGPTVAWHANGQRKMLGQYLNDIRVGRFQWWHENGTKALEGRYRQGRKVGTWTWWHANGMKSIEGTYQDDEPIGAWNWWDENGQITSQDDYGEGGESTGVLVDPTQSDVESNDPDAGDSERLDLKSNPPGEGIDQMEEINPMEPFDFDDNEIEQQISPLPQPQEKSGANEDVGGNR